MLIEKIDLILPSDSRYQVLHHFTRKLAEAFERKGIKSRVIDPKEDLLSLCSKETTDATLAFNGAPQIADDLLLCEVNEVPHICCMIDPPFHYMELIGREGIIITCDDKANIKFLEQMQIQKQVKNEKGIFFTQGVEPELAYHDEEEKEYDIVMTASYFDVGKAENELKERYPKEIITVIEEAIEQSLYDENSSIWENIEKILTTHVSNFSNDFQANFDFKHLLYLASYILKGKARNHLIENLKGFQIHVWDSRWKDFAKKHHLNLIIHEAVNYENCLNIIKKAKISLCNSIRSAYGCNEKVLNALACNAIAITNSNPFMREQFIDDEEIIFYNHREMTCLPDKIAILLRDEELRRHIAKQGKKKVLTSHTWDARLNDLLLQIKNR